MAKMKSGNASWMGGRVASERAVVKGIKSDAAQYGIRSPGKSVGKGKLNKGKSSTLPSIVTGN